MSGNSHPKEPGDPEVTAPVPPEAGATRVPPSPEDATWRLAHLRKSNPVNEVAPLTRKWLGRLRQDVLPINLIGQYPRIVNLIAAAWDNPTAFGEYLTDLLYDFRGNRAGFPAEIVWELRALRDCYYAQSSRKT